MTEGSLTFVRGAFVTLAPMAPKMPVLTGAFSFVVGMASTGKSGALDGLVNLSIRPFQMFFLNGWDCGFGASSAPKRSGMVIGVEVGSRIERISIGSSAMSTADLLVCKAIGTGEVGTSVGRSWSPPALISL